MSMMMLMMNKNLVYDMDNVQRPDKENATLIGCVRWNLQNHYQYCHCTSIIWCPVKPSKHHYHCNWLPPQLFDVWNNETITWYISQFNIVHILKHHCHYLATTFIILIILARIRASSSSSSSSRVWHCPLLYSASLGTVLPQQWFFVAAALPKSEDKKFLTSNTISIVQMICCDC